MSKKATLTLFCYQEQPVLKPIIMLHDFFPNIKMKAYMHAGKAKDLATLAEKGSLGKPAVQVRVRVGLGCEAWTFRQGQGQV